MRHILVLAVLVASSLIVLIAPFNLKPAEAIILPHMNPDQRVLSIDTKNGSTVQASNPTLTLYFSVCRDIGASFSDVFSPSEGWFHYSIDNQAVINATPTAISSSVATVTSHHGGPTQHETTHYSIKVDLHSQTNGSHNITSSLSFTILPPIFGDLLHYRAFSVVYFTVTGMPTIQIQSLQNLTHNLSDFPINFVTNEHVSSVTYSLDGQQNVTADGNTTISNLPNGTHNITLFACDTAGNWASPEMVQFDIAVENNLNLGSLQSLVNNSSATVVIAVVLAVVFVSTLVFALRYRRKNRI